MRVAIAAVVLGAVFAGFIAATFIFRDLEDYNPAIDLPLLGLLGVLALIVGLTILTVVAAALGLSTRSYALGLPPGSIRAVIALGLLVTFLVMTVFVYAGMRDVETLTSEGVSAEVKDRLLASAERVVRVTERHIPDEADPNKEKIIYNVTIVMPQNVAKQDFAKQLLTTLATLLVAMVGFYYGSRTVAQQQEEREEAELRIVEPGSSPHTMKPTDTFLRIRLRSIPPDESVAWEAPLGDPSGQLTPLEPGTFEYRPSAGAGDVVKLRFSLVRYPSATAELAVTRVAAQESKENSGGNGNQSGEAQEPSVPG